MLNQYIPNLGEVTEVDYSRLLGDPLYLPELQPGVVPLYGSEQASCGNIIGHETCRLKKKKILKIKKKRTQTNLIKNSNIKKMEQRNPLLYAKYPGIPVTAEND